VISLARHGLRDRLLEPVPLSEDLSLTILASPGPVYLGSWSHKVVTRSSVR
jgi:hypothetical protein